MSTAKTVLFISYDGMTDPLGQSQVIPYLQGISKAGYHIILLSCEKKQAFLKNRTVVEKLLTGYDIKWVPLNYTKNPPVLSTLLDIAKIKRTVKKLVAENKIDMVHTRPGIPSMVGLWMKKKFGVKFLNDIREFYADSRVEGGMWNIKNPIYKLIYTYFKKQEEAEVENSDGIVCLTYAGQDIIQQWPEYKKGIPFQVIPCSADLALFNMERISTAEKEALKKELNIGKDNIIVSYLGSIGGWYLTDEMMEFCKMLSDRMPQVRFLFISPHRHDKIRDAAAKYRLDSARIIIQKAARLEVPALLSLSDYSIFFIKPCYSKQSSSPTKHGEIMAMGIPLITNSGVGDVETIVEKYSAGFVLDGFIKSEMENVIDKMADPSTAFDAGDIRRGAFEFYDLEKGILKYIQVYKEILG